jgi:dihydrofolate reductase
MSRLILWNLVTLDGFFEGEKSWDLDWHNLVWGEELEELSLTQLQSARMLLFGRVTYEGMAQYWATAEGKVAQLMNSLPKLVFSRTLTHADWHNTRLVKSDAVQEVAALKTRPGEDMFVFGSAVLASFLMPSGLIDEYRLCLVPAVLGKGNPLFKPTPQPVAMRLLEARALKSGGVILRYEHAPTTAAPNNSMEPTRPAAA